jgi:cysteine desulfurase family protein
MIYLDNSATGGFKPSAVIDSAFNTLKYLCANPGRSGHRLAVTGAELIFDARKEISELVNCSIERVAFTKNCTESLNTAIFGLYKKGGHVITTVYEHNSVLRPLYHLEKLGLISLSVVSPKDQDIVSAISEKINHKTCLVVTTALSNVTGDRLPIKTIGRLCRSKKIKYIVDGAQAGGHIPLDIKNDYIDALCLAGHKGLYGIMTSGVLAFNDDTNVTPLTYGGTGIETFNLDQPKCYPEKLESGTLNLPAIASLKEGVFYVKKNLNNFQYVLEGYVNKTIDALRNIKGVKVYSKPNTAGIVSFSFNDIDSETASDIYNKEYDIAVRGGFHCAPLIHRFLGTDKNGLVRASFSPHNSLRELSSFIKATEKIANS